MCFNVFAHNRDDHSKNFSFLYDESKREWHLSPAYDLTYSSSFNGEHATTINGEGKNPSLEDILAVAKNIGIKEKQAKEIAIDIKDKCSSLFDWSLSECKFINIFRGSIRSFKQKSGGQVSPPYLFVKIYY